jgi:hypothetical protein
MVLRALTSKNESWKGKGTKPPKDAKSLGKDLPSTFVDTKRPQSVCFCGGFGQGGRKRWLGRQQWRKKGKEEERGYLNRGSRSKG